MRFISVEAAKQTLEKEPQYATVRRTGGKWMSGPHLLRKLVEESKWLANEKGIMFAMEEEVFYLIPEELREIVANAVNQANEMMFIIAQRFGFNPSQWQHMKAVDHVLVEIETEWNQALDRASKERAFAGRSSWKEYMITSVMLEVLEIKK